MWGVKGDFLVQGSDGRDNFVCLLNWNSDNLHYREHCKLVSRALAYCQEKKIHCEKALSVNNV